MEDYGQIVKGKAAKCPSLQDVLIIRQDLFNAARNASLCSPAASVLTPSNFGATYKPPTEEILLPAQATSADICLIPSREVMIKHEPIPLADMPISIIVEDPHISLSREDRAKVEVQTRGQNKNINWYHHRRGSITSSNFSKYRRFMGKVPSTNPNYLKQKKNIIK